MYETTITIAGNLVSDVDFRTTTRGDSLARFRVASTMKRYDRASGGWTDGDTIYWTVTAWRRAAENARDSLAKGLPVMVHGRVRQRTVDRPVAEAPGVSVPITFTDVEALHFGLDLSRCRASFQRAPIGPQTSPEPAREPLGGSAAPPVGSVGGSTAPPVGGPAREGQGVPFPGPAPEPVPARDRVDGQQASAAGPSAA